MDYRIYYLYNGNEQDVELNRCENLMDALYKFYEAHGLLEITMVFKL